MLAPDDRAVLREQLRPPPGYELDIAVATTFTLDLTAALVAPLAFASHALTRSTDPIAMLEAVRSAADRLDVFCQAGHIRVPAKASDLMAFLEPMVHEVRSPHAGYLFHPKVWVLRYRADDDEAHYRLLCGTRNLTDDVSWDAVVCLDATRAGRPSAGNRSLADFVRSLPDLSTTPLGDARRARILDLAEDLRHLEWEMPAGVKDVAFHTLGLRDRRGGDALDGALAGSRHLVVSPFLDDDAISSLRQRSNDLVVVSRSEAFEALETSTVEGMTCRVVSPLAGLAQPDDGIDDAVLGAPTAAAGGLLGGLHAKVYVVEQGQRARLLIGSSNATSAGLRDHNVEFMVELSGGRASLGVDQFLAPEAPFASILEHYQPTGGQPESSDDLVGRELENLLRRLASEPMVAEVEADGEGWSEHVRGAAFADHANAADLRVSLLTKEGIAVKQAGTAIDAHFGKLAMAEITPFVILTASAMGGSATVQRSAVVRAVLRHDPPSRLDEVLARQVDTPEKFMRLVALMLGLANPFPVAGDGAVGDGRWLLARAGDVGLFELLIRAVADRPQAIDDLDRLVERLRRTGRGQMVFPDGFDALWSTIRSARATEVTR